jgi:hypothetical protein
MSKKRGLLLGTPESLPESHPRKVQVSAPETPSPFAPVPTNGPYGNRDNHEKLMLFRRGFKDGAGAIAHRYPTEPAYMKGYEDGSKARSIACKVFCEEIGHDPTYDILRCIDENAPTTR